MHCIANDDSGGRVQFVRCPNRSNPGLPNASRNRHNLTLAAKRTARSCRIRSMGLGLGSNGDSTTSRSLLGVVDRGPWAPSAQQHHHRLCVSKPPEAIQIIRSSDLRRRRPRLLRLFGRCASPSFDWDRPSSPGGLGTRGPCVIPLHMDWQVVI
jgi:hypothetical protein